MIIDKKELEKTLREGGDPDIIKETFMATLDTIQNKINAEARPVTDEPHPHTSNSSAPEKQQQKESESKTKQDKRNELTESILDSLDKLATTYKEFAPEKFDNWYDFWDSLTENETREEKNVRRQPRKTEQSKPAQDPAERNPAPKNKNGDINTKQSSAIPENKDKSKAKPADVSKSIDKAENKSQKESGAYSDLFAALTENYKAIEEKFNKLSTLLNSSIEKLSQNENSAEPAKTIAKETEAPKDTDLTLDTLLNETYKLIVDNPYSKDYQKEQEKEKKAGASCVTNKAELPRSYVEIEAPYPWLLFGHHHPFFWF